MGEPNTRRRRTDGRTEPYEPTEADRLPPSIGSGGGDGHGCLVWLLIAAALLALGALVYRCSPACEDRPPDSTAWCQEK